MFIFMQEKQDREAQQEDVANKEVNLKLAEIEAILFASGDPLNIEKIQKFLKLTKTQIKDSIKSLSVKYNSSDGGLQLIQKKGKIQLATKANLSRLVAEFLGKSLNEELSKSSLETLAVVAYRGPVTRVQIEYIRGVNCSYALRVLSLRGIVDRKDNPLDSRSYLYEISFDFLKSLGLENIEELDEYEKLKEQLPTEEEVVETSENSVDDKNI
jgi:segregation and condensation protein B